MNNAPLAPLLESTFHLLFEKSADPILLVDGNIFVDCNKAAVEILGYKKKEEMLLLHPSLLSPELQPDGRQSDEKADEMMATAFREGNHRFEWVHKRADGELFPVEVLLTAIPLGERQVLYTVWRDISERKRSEEALCASEVRFRSLIEQSPLSTMVFAPDGTPLVVNRAYEELFGISLEQLEGWNILKDEQLKELGIGHFIERGFAGEATAIPPALFDRAQSVPGVSYREGPKIWVRAFVYPVKDESNNVREVVIVHDDITHGKLAEEAQKKAREDLERRVEERTVELGRANSALQSEIAERKRAEEALQHAKEEAERANHAKSDFLSRMSHELRTPLNSILGFAQVLSRKATAENERRSLDHILKAGHHLLNLINEVLDISRIEANRLQLSPEPVLTSHVLQETLNLIQHLAAQRGTQIRDEVTPLCDLYIRADRQRLTQVLLNLVSNAVKYSPDGSIVRVSCERVGAGCLRIKVTDNGPGIAQEKLERLFSPFERLGAEHSGVEGTGLGLALSKGLVEAMGGTMGVASAPREGSTFWLELPIVESPRERLERTHEDIASLAENLPAHRSITLLYIEDNLANLSLIETILEDRADIKLLSALQGRLGLELAWEHRPDCILLDLHLPDITGGEVLEGLRADARSRDIPVVVISADATPGQIKKIIAQGAQAYLTKPLDVGLFLTTLEQALQEKGT